MRNPRSALQSSASIFGQGAEQHTVDIEAPAPGDIGGESATYNRTEGTGNSPGSAKEGVVHRAFPESRQQQVIDMPCIPT